MFCKYANENDVFENELVVVYGVILLICNIDSRNELNAADRKSVV